MKIRPKTATLSRVAALLALVLAAGACVSGVGPGGAGSDFTLVVLPDIQYMVSWEPELPMWKSLCRWVVANREARSIKAVLSVGDVTDQASAREFETASDGLRTMEDAGIPCVPVVGNHDYDRLEGRSAGNGARDRSAKGFDRVFGPDRFRGKPWYGGNLDGSDANYFVTLGIDKAEILVVALEVFPRRQAVEWASRVIDEHPGSQVIVLTHAYLYPDGSRLGKAAAAGYGLEGDCSGVDLWNLLIRRKPNILAVISGHISASPHSAHHTATGDSGNVVHEIFLDYQAANAGDGWVGLLEFRPSLGVLEMSSYRTYAPSGLGPDPSAPAYTLSWPGASRARAR